MQIYGAAGREGKEFLKMLSPDVVSKVVCLVNVDRKKINSIKMLRQSSTAEGQEDTDIALLCPHGGWGCRQGRREIWPHQQGEMRGDNSTIASLHRHAGSNKDSNGGKIVPPLGARQTCKAEKAIDPIDSEVLW